MSETLLAVSRSLSADVQRLATISHNVANMNTPGYRGVRTVAHFSEQIRNSGQLQLRTHTALDQRDGGLTQTDRKLDLALRGPGFFVVERNGVPLLTRAGAFRVDAAGLLVTTAGDRVLGSGGPISVPAGELRVDPEGTLWLGSQSLDRLHVVTAADAARLRPAGSGAYAYDGAIEASTSAVVQGALERSNVDPAEQTVLLMETTRHAESVQRAISIYDQAMDTGINRLGDN